MKEVLCLGFSVLDIGDLMIIKDEVHGTIEFCGLEKRIIDTPDFQRLRRIKQMSFTNLVYPGANHTRFEHSLGTAYLSGIIAERIGLDNDSTKKVKLYGLLHDIGHTAFSHEGEDVLAPLIGNHELLGEERITSGPIADIIGENYNPKEIANLGKAKEGSIINSDIGADRMDYLKRDALNTGVAYGVIDTDRLMHTLAMHEGELVISEAGLEAAESLLVGRFMMFSAVYLHSTVRIATAMLHKAIALSLEDKTVEATEFKDMADDEALSRMNHSEKAGIFVEGLVGRKLYKEVAQFDNDRNGRRDAESARKKLEQSLGCQMLIDIPYPFVKITGFGVITSEGVKPIEEISGLICSLKKSEESRMKVLLLAPPDKRDVACKMMIR